MSKWLFYLLVLMSVLFTSFFVARKIKKNHVPQIDLSAIVLKGLNGQKITIGRFSNKPVIINFWATWCGPCRQEFPGFEKARLKYSDKVNFVMASDEAIEKIQSFKKSNGYTLILYTVTSPLS